MKNFALCLIEWQKQHGRHGLPWQQTRDPYAVWLSEIMLQQTQVSSVIPYYQRFIARYPNIASLAAASQDEVLSFWSGLGYYARGRNLHRAAQMVMAEHDGVFPSDLDGVIALPGVGRSTAAAILAFSFGQRRAILDGNVKRVLTRCFGITGYPGNKAVENTLWQKAEQLLPETGIESYTQALMDLGATLCSRKPNCEACPLQTECIARIENRISELPEPRPRKSIPQKEIAMLVVFNQGEVYLEKRPPTGIWGGMWSFPEAEINDEESVDRFGVSGKIIQALPEIQHTFTHFRLRIVPKLVKITKRLHKTQEPVGLWLTTADALGAAIPKPVRDILLTLQITPK